MKYKVRHTSACTHHTMGCFFGRTVFPPSLTLCISIAKANKESNPVRAGAAGYMRGCKLYGTPDEYSEAVKFYAIVILRSMSISDLPQMMKNEINEDARQMMLASD